MPVYNGIYYYMNDFEKVGAVGLWENRWWARYEILEDTNLPLSMTPENFPERDGCPFLLYREEFLDKLNDTDENLVVYTQDEKIFNKIISHAPPSARASPRILRNGVELYKWTKYSPNTGKNFGIVILYDKDAKMMPRVAGIIWLALIVAIAVIIYTSLQVYNNYLTQQYTTQRQHEALEALRYQQRTTLYDSEGNPVAEIFQFGNGSVFTYKYDTGEFNQIQKGATADDLLNTIPQGNVGAEVGIEKIMETLMWVIIAIVIVVAIVFIISALLRRR